MKKFPNLRCEEHLDALQHDHLKLRLEGVWGYVEVWNIVLVFVWFKYGPRIPGKVSSFEQLGA